MASGATFLVVASEWDEAAQKFAERHRAPGVQLLTPRDLSRTGWNYSLDRMGERSQAVVMGGLLAGSHIDGVLTRLACVREQDLPHIVAGDRAYVTAEMNAFLLAWLTTLPCPVLNRPTPCCLSGRWWRDEQWVRVAYHLGIPIRPVNRRIHLVRRRKPTAASHSGGTTVTLVGNKHIGAADPVLIAHTRHLAQTAGTDLLAVRFTGPSPDSAFLEATPWPDIADDLIGDAVMDYLAKEHTGKQGSEEAA